MRLRSLFLALVMLSVASVTACTGDDAGDVDAGPPSLVGTWRAIPNPLAGEPPPPDRRTLLTFGADGVLDWVRPTDVRTYDWRTDGDILTLTARGGGTPRVQSFPYYVGDGDYFDVVMRSADAGSGFVGVWERRRIADTVEVTERYTLRADGTGEARALQNGQTAVVFDARWRAVGEFLEIFVSDDIQVVDVVYLERRGDVIGAPYELVVAGP